MTEADMLLRMGETSRSAITSALALLPKHLDSLKARVMMLAIGLQESRLEYRRQLGNGPARGLWQFEKGGVTGVLKHSLSTELLRELCRARDCAFEPGAIWAKLETDDVLAAGVARLLLWTDRRALPQPGDSPGAWDYYLRNWRPGKPHPKTWAAFHAAAVDFVFPTTEKGTAP